MPNSQHEHHDFNIIHVIDNSVITHTNAIFPLTTSKLRTTLWARVIGKLAYFTHEASSNGFIKLTQRFGCCRPVGNGIRHPARSEVELCEQFFIRDRRAIFSTGLRRRLDIGEIL